MPAILSPPGFVIIPNEILLDITLSAEAKVTFGVLKHFDRGRGCFCKKETLARFTKLSLFRLRKALKELGERGIITIQPRKMGMTDLIRVVKKDWDRDVQTATAEEPTIEPPDLEVEEPWIEALQIEPPKPDSETADPPVESVQPRSEIPVAPAGNDCHSKENKTKNTSINTPPSYTGRLEASPPKEGVIKEVIDHFFQLKEQRPAALTEIKHWSPVAAQLLQDFTVEEVKGAIDYAVNIENARLFYFIGLSAPGYIHSQRKSQERDSAKHVQEPPQQEQNEERRRQIHREERKQNNPYKSETQDLLKALSQHVRPQSYNVWFRDLFIGEIKENRIVLDVCSQPAADFIERKYGSLLEEITGKQVKCVS